MIQQDPGIGTDWVEDLPEGWHTLKLKHIASVQNSNVDKKSEEGEQPVRLCNYVDVYYNDRITPDLNFMEATATLAEIRKFRLREGDVIITKDSEARDDIAIPAYVMRDFEDVLCGYHLALLRPHSSMDGRFLKYCFGAEMVNLQFQVAANGITRYGLSLDALRGALFPVPPLEEQCEIADFLDQKTAAIDAIVRKKERLIDLLQEKRQAVISRAVTRGLDPEVEMKDSGMEWVGDVPAHWEVLQLRRVLRSIEQGWSPSCESRQADEGEWGVLKAGCVNYGKLNWSEHKALPPSLDPVPELAVRAGDLLMSRASGSPHLVGSVAYVDSYRPKMMISDKIFRLRPESSRAMAPYLALSLNSRFARAQIEQAIRGAEGLANNISQESVRELWIPLPPLNEQEEIVGGVAKKLTSLDKAIHMLEKQIGILRERRQTLISNAVTGKINVWCEAA